MKLDLISHMNTAEILEYLVNQIPKIGIPIYYYYYYFNLAFSGWRLTTRFFAVQGMYKDEHKGEACPLPYLLWLRPWIPNLD